MKIFQEIYIQAKSVTDEALVDLLGQFSRRTPAWSFMAKQSEEYASAVGQPSCMLSLKDGKYEPAFALTKKSKGIFYVANIVPKEAASIPMQEYNALGRRFGKDFGRFAHRMRIPVAVHLSAGDIGLSGIITSPKIRKFFERYLHSYPASYHPSDIERLDTFICAIARYSRKRIDIDRLERYLIQELKWSSKDAEWCHDRIKTGLDILEVNRRF